VRATAARSRRQRRSTRRSRYAELRVIANADHVGNMERPQDFSNEIRRFAGSN
jgi:hypothetical protein